VPASWGLVCGHNALKPHAVGLQLVPQVRAEPIRRETPEVGHGLLQTADGARDVVRPAAAVRGQPSAGIADEVDQCLARHHDVIPWAGHSGMTNLPASYASPAALAGMTMTFTAVASSRPARRAASASSRP
jgi:hypothetical protein